MRLYAILAAMTIAFTAQPAGAQPRKITLSNAIQAALENNANIQIAEEQTVQATARAQEQRAALLPNLNGVASYLNQSINLSARGFRFPGVPILIGPFSAFDLRVQFSEPILDLSLLRRYQSSRRGADASEFETEALKNKIAAMVARLYFNVQRSRAMVESFKAQIDLDNSLLKLARDRQELGAGTVLDVTRAESRLATDQHRLLAAQNEARTAELQLLRAMGERPTPQVELLDSLAPSLADVDTPDRAVQIAFQNRPEIKAEEKKVEAALLLSRAAKAERFPNVNVFGDYGDSGNREIFVPTRAIGVQMQLPLFDGGRRSARRTTTESQLRQAEVRANDMRDEVELEVRVAIDNLTTAREQLRATDQALKLAQEELELSRLRFEAQVTTQLDVVNAQAQLSDVRSRLVNAQAILKSAEVEYQRATGVVIR